ncbi:MAG: trigger factor [Gloeomargarita sp. DG_2_bins_126]
MKITQEPLPKSQLGLRVEIPAADVAKRHEQVFKKFLKSVRLPGFRQGKVPPHILRQYVGEVSIRASVVEELLETAMPQALRQIEVATLGEPKLRDELETLVHNFQPDQPFVFEMAVDVWPEVTLGDDYRHLQIRATQYEFNPESVEDTLYSHQFQRATLVPVERPVQKGDVAIIDIDGYRQTEAGRGEAVADFHGRDMQVEVDVDMTDFYPEVVEALVGMQIGETKTVTLVTDDKSWEGHLANQTFILEFTLKELKERELPPLDDLFAQAISDCETMAELRAFLTERGQAQAQERTQTSIEEALTDALLEITTTELPHTLVERHLTDLFNEVLNNFARRGIDAKELDRWLTQERVQQIGKELLPVAQKRVKRVLALKAVAEQEQLTPDAAAVAEAMTAARRTEMGRSLSEAELEEVVRESLRLKLAVEWLQAHAEITLIPPQQEPAAAQNEPEAEADLSATAPAATPDGIEAAATAPTASPADAEA